MKKINLLVVMIVIMTILTSSTVFAGSSAAKIKVTVNKKNLKYDVQPFMKNGKVMIPVKQTSEALGAKVVTDKKNKTIIVNLNMMHVEITTGKSEFYIHRDADFSGIPQTVKLNTPIKNVMGAVFVPAIQFVESLGMKVTWNSKKRVLSIITDKSTNENKAGTLPTKVKYEEITLDSLKGNDILNNWYTENNQKQGISFKRDGKYMYALIGAGEKPTGGYSVKLDNIYYSNTDTITINARVTPPGDNVRVMMVITYPSMLIRIKSDKIKTVNGEIIGAKTSSGKEKWITMDSSTVTKMELYNLDQVKIRDITGSEEDEIMKSFNEATLDQNPYIEMIAGNTLKVSINDGTILRFTSYGSETNVIVNFEKDGEFRTFHLIAPVIAKLLLSK